MGLEKSISRVKIKSAAKWVKKIQLMQRITGFIHIINSYLLIRVNSLRINKPCIGLFGGSEMNKLSS